MNIEYRHSSLNENLIELQNWKQANLESLIWDGYLINATNEEIGNIEELNSIIFEKALTLIETGKIQFWNGASMAVNYFCHFDNEANHFRMKALTVKIVEIFWDYYNNDPLKLNIKNGALGLIMSLCNSYRISPNSELIDIIKKVAIEIKQLKIVTDSNCEFLNIFPSDFERENHEITLDNTLSWSSGNLSMALLMYNLGLCLDESYMQWAYRIIGFSTIQTIDKIENSHSAFTTGTLGNSVLYNFFYEVFKEEKFKIASEYWLEQARIVELTEITAENEGIEQLIKVTFVEDSLNTGNKNWTKLFMIH
jgi:Lanthionine synthetase C-like protein